MNETLYKSLMDISDISALSTDQALNAMGKLVDVSTDLQRIEGLERAKDQLNKLLTAKLTFTQQSIAHYFLGNAWSFLRTLKRKESDLVWDWEQEELEQEITHFRLAIRGATESGFPAMHLCQIYTNLGNALNHVGRFVEAIDYWNMALEINPNFSMALGSKGFGLVHYAKVLYDNGHVGVLLKFAHHLLTEALKRKLHRGARKGFKKYVKDVESRLKPEFLQEPLDLEEFSLGRGQSEKSYRKWCLNQRLFLNPLNDLGPYNIAARDVLTCPSVVMGINEGPYYHGFFNQMKQEYVSARFLFYEGLESEKPHYSDRDVLLYNTLDYPSYALCIEEQKLAFRAAYSVLDKVAFFLNHYMRLGIRERDVSFRKLWYKKSAKESRVLRKEFAHSKNWVFHGLFWLAKDLYEDAPSFRDAMEPEAQNLAEIRNHIEHKYIKIHEELWSGPLDSSDEIGLALSDTLAYSVYRDEFANKVLKMLRLARAALVYLSLGIHIEERRKAAEREQKKIVAPMPLDKWEDKWKV